MRTGFFGLRKVEICVQLLEIRHDGPRSPTSNQLDDAPYPLLQAIHLRAPALPDLTPITKMFAIVP